MRTLLFIFPGVAVMALAFWAYSENYATQRSLGDVRDLHRAIGNEHEKLAVLRAEWAYLNRPDRLRELVGMNFGRLGLLPLRPHHFAGVEQVPFPAADLDDVTGITTLSSEMRP